MRSRRGPAAFHRGELAAHVQDRQAAAGLAVGSERAHDGRPSRGVVIVYVGTSNVDNARPEMPWGILQMKLRQGAAANLQKMLNSGGRHLVTETEIEGVQIGHGLSDATDRIIGNESTKAQIQMVKMWYMSASFSLGKYELGMKEALIRHFVVTHLQQIDPSVCGTPRQ